MATRNKKSAVGSRKRGLSHRTSGPASSVKKKKREANRPGGSRERQIIKASEVQAGRRGIILFGAAMSAPIVLAGLLLYIWTHLGVIRLGYRISEEKTVQARIVETNRMLRLERAKFSSLHRIENLGKRELGLVEPTPEQMVIIP